MLKQIILSNFICFCVMSDVQCICIHKFARVLSVNLDTALITYLCILAYNVMKCVLELKIEKTFILFILFVCLMSQWDILL